MIDRTALTALLRSEYGRNSPRTARHPTDSLIATILSQHTADRNSSAAFRQLRARYATWQEIADAEPEELADVIRVAGLGNIKARRIQAALRETEARYGHMDLAFLRDLPLEEARRELEALPGVGPKTAACVLLFACAMPALPVDTHIHRIARRLGLIGPRVSAEAAHLALSAGLRHDDVYDFHVNLIAHGRRVCQARDPLCGTCILQQHCSHYGAA